MAKSQIIKDLANGIIDTQTALKRTKVLLQDLEKVELLQWINYELEGYPYDVDVPKYREISGQLFGSYFKGSMACHMTYSNVPLSLGKMPANNKEKLLTTKITHGVQALKGILEQSEKSDNKGLVKSIHAELYPYIAYFNDDVYMNITSAEVKLDMTKILNVSSKVESKLLDILLYLEKEFGCLDELDIDVEGKTAEELTSIANDIYVMIYNDKSITIGDNNKIKESKIVSTVDGLIENS